MELRGIEEVDSIIKIANENICYIKGYKNKFKGVEDKALAELLMQQSKKLEINEFLVKKFYCNIYQRF